MECEMVQTQSLWGSFFCVRAWIMSFAKQNPQLFCWVSLLQENPWKEKKKKNLFFLSSVRIFWRRRSMSQIPRTKSHVIDFAQPKASKLNQEKKICCNNSNNNCKSK
jgi:hypothetical protein